MTVLEILSMSESTSNVNSKVIWSSASESRFSWVTWRVTVTARVAPVSRTKSLSSCSILAFTMLKKMSESLSTSTLISCESVGWLFLTENVSCMSLSSSKMVTSEGGSSTIQPWSPTWNSAIPEPDEDDPLVAASLLVAVIVIERSPKASSAKEYRTVMLNEPPAGMKGVLSPLPSVTRFEASTETSDR